MTAAPGKQADRQFGLLLREIQRIPSLLAVHTLPLLRKLPLLAGGLGSMQRIEDSSLMATCIAVSHHFGGGLIGAHLQKEVRE